MGSVREEEVRTLAKQLLVARIAGGEPLEAGNFVWSYTTARDFLAVCDVWQKKDRDYASEILAQQAHESAREVTPLSRGGPGDALTENAEETCDHGKTAAEECPACEHDRHSDGESDRARL